MRHRLAQVLLYFLIDIDEGGGHGDAFRHREAKSHGLPRLVIGVLTDDDHFHLVERTKVEGIEDEPARRIARITAILLAHQMGETGEIVFLKLRPKLPLP